MAGSGRDFDELKIDSVGTITQLEEDGQKQVLLLTDHEGKHMVVKIVSGYNLPTVIPEDPKITPLFEKLTGDGKRLFSEISDLRTYLTIPFVGDQGDNIGIQFQEYGGEENLMKSPITMKLAKMRVFKELDKRNLHVVDPIDLEKDRHYLIPEGRLSMPAVIDVLVKPASK